MGTGHTAVQKAFTQPAKSHRPATPYIGRFATCQKCRTSPVDGAKPYFVAEFQSNRLNESCVDIERFLVPHNVLFRTRPFRQTALQTDALYGFPTVARCFSEKRFVIEPIPVMLARFCTAWSLPLAREAIPREYEFMWK